MKTRSWFNDKGVQLAVHEWLQENARKPEAITGYALAKEVGGYLDSKKATTTVARILEPIGSENYGSEGN